MAREQDLTSPLIGQAKQLLKERSRDTSVKIDIAVGGTRVDAHEVIVSRIRILRAVVSDQVALTASVMDVDNHDVVPTTDICLESLFEIVDAQFFALRLLFAFLAMLGLCGLPFAFLFGLGLFCRSSIA